MKRICSLFCLLLVSAVVCVPNAAQEVATYIPSRENLDARKEFQDSKFGIFIHFGIYSMLGVGEWAMSHEHIAWDEYEKLASGFYPANFDAREWVSAIKDSGAKYICITSRHHDGFSMFATRQSDYNIVDATPFKRDILKELADECHRQGIKIHFYYSHIDWRRPDYPQGRSGQKTGKDPAKVDWPSYYGFMNRQLTELLTQYGPVGAIWFDGVWDQPKTFDWQLAEQYEMIHRLQPACLIGNNHHRKPYPGEDFQLFERDLPGENKAGFSAGQEVTSLPLETCQTMNRTWGYSITDHDYKSSTELIRLLVSAAGKNANLLMNIGPQPNGELPAASLQRLQEIGAWMRIYGETIYGTRGGRVPPRDWGVTTEKGNRVFVHVFHLQDKVLFLPITDKVKEAILFKDRTPVRFKQDKDGVLLSFDEVPDGIDTVVELVLR